MKYKAGDKVRVRKDLNTRMGSNGWHVNIDMTMLKGRVATILSVESYYYVLDVDGRKFGWTDEMLEDTQPTELIEWHYLPELPKATINVLVAVSNYATVKVGVYALDNNMVFVDGIAMKVSDNMVYAWAELPKMPERREG